MQRFNPDKTKAVVSMPTSANPLEMPPKEQKNDFFCYGVLFKVNREMLEKQKELSQSIRLGC